MSRGHRAARSAPISRIEGPDDWYRDAIIYEAHVRAFADSNGDGIGDFTGLAQRLDYLADLGVTAIWLLPFYPSPLRDDGYDIADYRTVHRDYGDLRSFKRFLAAAHARNIRVITELVVNHTSDQHPWFQRARRAPAGSPERDCYVWSDDPERYADARVIFSDFETSNWTWDPVAGAYFCHRFYSHQPDLNYDNPDVEAAVFDVLDFWLDLGVDGLRLDAVPYLVEREGTNCENLPETHDVLKRLRKHLDAHYPDRMLLAEANQWPEDAAAYFGDGDECHMNFHFPVMPRLFMALRLEHRTPILDIMEQTPEPPEGGQWATFLRNHDELTLEMVTDEERDLMLRAYATDVEMRINLGIRRRLAPLLGNDRRKIELLNALLFSLPGTPVIYYGDEIGMGDNVYLGDRNGVRTPMQWSADRNGGFSSANPHRLYLPLITEQGFHYESVNVETQNANPSSLLAWMRQLIALRKRHRVLGRGSIEFLEPDNHHVLAFVRRLEGEQPMLCVANLSRLAQYVELDLREFAVVDPGRGVRTQPVRSDQRPALLPDAGAIRVLLVRPRRRPVTPEDGATDDGQAASGIATVARLTGSWADVLRRRASLGRAIGRWIPDRRWFVGKGTVVRDVSVEDVVGPLGHGGVGHRADVVHRGRRPPVRRPAAAHLGRPGRGARAAAAGIADRHARRRGDRRRHGAGRGRQRRGRRRAASAHAQGADVGRRRSSPAARLHQAGRRPERRARAERRADELVGHPRRPADRQADPPADAGRQPRRDAADPPAGEGLRARPGRGRHAGRAVPWRGTGQRGRRPRRRPQRGRPVGVEPGPADPRGRAPRLRARRHRRRRGHGRGHRCARPGARPRCTSASPMERPGSSPSRSRCCSSARSCRACGRRCGRRSASSVATSTGCPTTPASWQQSLLDDGDRLLGAFDDLRTRKLDAAPHPGPRRPPPRPGAVDRARRRVHRLRGRARSTDRRAVDQAVAAHRRGRDHPLARLRREGRAGHVDRARSAGRGRRSHASSSGGGGGPIG